MNIKITKDFLKDKELVTCHEKLSGCGSNFTYAGLLFNREDTVRSMIKFNDIVTDYMLGLMRAKSHVPNSLRYYYALANVGVPTSKTLKFFKKMFGEDEMWPGDNEDIIVVFTQDEVIMCETIIMDDYQLELSTANVNFWVDVCCEQDKIERDEFLEEISDAKMYPLLKKMDIEFNPDGGGSFSLYGTIEDLKKYVRYALSGNKYYVKDFNGYRGIIQYNASNVVTYSFHNTPCYLYDGRFERSDLKGLVCIDNMYLLNKIKNWDEYIY